MKLKFIEFKSPQVTSQEMAKPGVKAGSTSLCSYDKCIDTSYERFFANHTSPHFRLTMHFDVGMWLRKWSENSWCSCHLLDIFSMSRSSTDGKPLGTVSILVLKQNANYLAKPQHSPFSMDWLCVPWVLWSSPAISETWFRQNVDV